MKKNVVIFILIILILVTISNIFYSIPTTIDDNRVTLVDIIGDKIPYSKRIEDYNARELVGILEGLEYNSEPSGGTVGYTMRFDNGDIYYIKPSCNEVLKNGKQAEISAENLQKFEDIISNSGNTRIGLGDLSQEFPVEEAVELGYFVIDGRYGENKIYNKDVLDKIIENTKIDAENRVEDKIRIANYNIYGYPTIYELEYKIFNQKYRNEERKKS